MQSTNLAESSFLSSMLRGAGRGPSLAFAPRISRSQVLMAPSSSRVPGMVVCSEKGKVMNLTMWRGKGVQAQAQVRGYKHKWRGKGVQAKPVHLLVKRHPVPPVP